MPVLDGTDLLTTCHLAEHTALDGDALGKITATTTGNGTFSWNGIAGTEWWYDPKNDVFMVFLIQDRALLSEYQRKNRTWIYDALKK